ncbi:histidine kinase [Fibrella aquatilis]|uniref:Signal transduction histidine kinase n=1 Tax=Fibrella aquatilis TaxID=2817059 RepID=A0A939K2A3_9BACT|nr:histidine kinase [Fibrella aquatilis]MBO0933881.1 hypothetical protein [Fibrella aquatilis]
MQLFRFLPTWVWLWLIVAVRGTSAMAQSEQSVGQLTYFHDAGSTVTAAQLTQPAAAPRFCPYQADSVAEKQMAGSTLWLRFVAHNPSQHDTLTQVVYAGRQPLLQLYVLNETGQPQQTASGGTLADWPATSYIPDGYGLPFRLLPGQHRTLLLALQPGLFFNNGLETPVLYSLSGYRAFKQDLFFRQRWLLILYAFVIGSLFFGSSFALFQYATRRDRALIYYAGVAFFSALMVIRIADYNLEIRTVSLLVHRFFAYEYAINSGAAGCYLLFLSELLHLKKNAPRLHRLTNGLIMGCGVVFILSLWFTPLLIDQSAGMVALAGLPLLTAFTIGLTGCVLAVVGLAYYRNLPLSGYFLVGLLLITAGYVVMLGVLFWGNEQGQSATAILLNTPSVYLILGILAEMLCFSLALGERTRQLERTRIELQLRQKTLEKQAQEALLLGQTQERKRVAAELHDTLGGTLAAIRLTMKSLNANELNTKEQTTYQQLMDMVGMAIQQMRHLAHNMLPDELAKQGLVSGLTTLLSNLNLNQQTQFIFNTRGLTQRLDKQTEFTLYAIALEVCHNILKHACASQATVDLVQQAGKLHLLICDNGVGFDMGADTAKTGMGLTNLHERANSLGAALTVWSQPGEGSVVSLWVPLGVLTPS